MGHVRQDEAVSFPGGTLYRRCTVQAVGGHGAWKGKSCVGRSAVWRRAARDVSPYPAPIQVGVLSYTYARSDELARQLSSSAGALDPALPLATVCSDRMLHGIYDQVGVGA